MRLNNSGTERGRGNAATRHNAPPYISLWTSPLSLSSLRCAWGLEAHALLLFVGKRATCSVDMLLIHSEAKVRKKNEKVNTPNTDLNYRYICVMELSKNFTLKELTASNTAKAKGIVNEPDAKQLSAMQILVDKVLQPLREGIGKSIKVSSGLRVPALNKAIGGSVTSQHCKGEAADIRMSGKTGNADLFHYIKENLVFDQLIWEFGTEGNPDWVHVSYSAKGNRGEILKAYKKDGRTRYMLYK